MQLKFLLPFLLIGYKCIGEASTETSLLRINDFVRSICSLLERLGNRELGAHGVTLLVSTITACLNATASLTNECIKAIHQLENKKSESRKMLHLKLAYSVELFFSHASLAFALPGSGENRESNPVLYRVLHLSIQSIQSVLNHSNIQIQAVGLQAVKVMLQKGIGEESNWFLIFYVGELIEDLFVIVRNILESTITREAVAIVGECLKILMLLQTSSKGTDLQKGLIHLLLEAVLLIFSTSDVSLSQEANELRDIAVKLVSQLAQIPSSAVSIRDVLLSMPVMQRQQLQDIIRASVVQDKNPKPMSSSGPPLVIKLPAQTDKTEEKHSLPFNPSNESSNYSSAEEDDEDDDWDTFQSFPASGNQTAPPPKRPSSVSGSSTNSDYEDKNSGSPSLTNKENNLSIEDNEVGDDDSDTEADGATNWMDESHGPEDNSIGSLQIEEIVLVNADEELLPNIQSGQVEEEVEHKVEHTELSSASNLKKAEADGPPNRMDEFHSPQDSYIGSSQTDEMVSGIADEELSPDIQPSQVEDKEEVEHAELSPENNLKKTKMGPSKENDHHSPLSDNPILDSIPSDEHLAENSND